MRQRGEPPAVVGLFDQAAILEVGQRASDLHEPETGGASHRRRGGGAGDRHRVEHLLVADRELVARPGRLARVVEQVLAG